MRRPGLTGSFWPSQREESLLRAALLTGDRAMDAWRYTERWLDIDRVPGGTLRVLPLLYSNLKELGVDTPIMARLKGLYRRTWFVNQFVLARTREIVSSLEEAGIDPLILKGAAIAQRYYGDVGLRPMGDLDVLVPDSDVTSALERLHTLGWEREQPHVPTAELLRRAHGVALTDGSPITCDLHWTVLEDLLFGPASDPTQELWSGASQLSLGDVRTRALGPTDQLLHAIVHGARQAPEARLQWIEDAVMILRGAEIDWRRFTDLAIRVHATVPVADALWYLRRRFAYEEVPPEPIALLRSAPIAPLERAAYGLAGSAFGGRLGLFPINVARYARATRGMGAARRVAGFPRHLQLLWELGSVRDVPGAFVRKAGAALRGSPARVHGIEVRGRLDGHHELVSKPDLVNGIRIDPVEPADLAGLIDELVRCGRSHLVCTVSADSTVLARRDPELRGALRTADVNLPGDAWVAAALRLRGRRDPAIAGSDALRHLLHDDVERSFRHYLFGVGAGERLRSRLETAFPGVKIVGAEVPPTGAVNTWDLTGLAERARAAGAHLIWIGIGTPKQELAGHRLRNMEAAPVILGVGTSFGPGRLSPPSIIDSLAFAQGVVGERLAGWRRAG